MRPGGRLDLRAVLRERVSLGLVVERLGRELDLGPLGVDLEDLGFDRHLRGEERPQIRVASRPGVRFADEAARERPVAPMMRTSTPPGIAPHGTHSVPFAAVALRARCFGRPTPHGARAADGVDVRGLARRRRGARCRGASSVFTRRRTSCRRSMPPSRCSGTTPRRHRASWRRDHAIDRRDHRAPRRGVA